MQKITYQIAMQFPFPVGYYQSINFVQFMDAFQ